MGRAASETRYSSSPGYISNNPCETEFSPRHYWMMLANCNTRKHSNRIAVATDATNSTIWCPSGLCSKAKRQVDKDIDLDVSASVGWRQDPGFGLVPARGLGRRVNENISPLSPLGDWSAHPLIILSRTRSTQRKKGSTNRPNCTFSASCRDCPSDVSPSLCLSAAGMTVRGSRIERPLKGRRGRGRNASSSYPGWTAGTNERVAIAGVGEKGLGRRPTPTPEPTTCACARGICVPALRCVAMRCAVPILPTRGIDIT